MDAGTTRPTLMARPPAKVNLTLEIGPMGDDGYHPLRSVFLRIGLSDLLSVSPARSGDPDHLVVTGLARAPIDDNIVLRAVALLREVAGVSLPALQIELDKRIPLAAGLGGGSSDAAAGMALAQASWGIGLAPAACQSVASRLGSDVPFFANGAAAALVEGRGEQITTLPPPAGQVGVLLASVPVELSTREVFARHDALASVRARSRRSVTDALAAALEGGMAAAELVHWSARLHDSNDLWPASSDLVPSLAHLRAALERRTGRPWLMSGSGPTLFAFYSSAADAAAAGADLASSMPAGVEGTILHATDLVGPDPTWRHI